MPAKHFGYYKGTFRRMVINEDPPYVDTPALMRGHRTYYNEKIFLVVAVKIGDQWEKKAEVYKIKIEELDNVEQITEAEYLGVLLQCQKI